MSFCLFFFWVWHCLKYAFPESLIQKAFQTINSCSVTLVAIYNNSQSIRATQKWLCSSDHLRSSQSFGAESSCSWLHKFIKKFEILLGIIFKVLKMLKEGALKWKQFLGHIFYLKYKKRKQIFVDQCFHKWLPLWFLICLVVCQTPIWLK